MDALSHLADPNLIIFGKLALAALLGMIIGTERTTAGKGAGTRTFSLVSLGSCLFMTISYTIDNQFLGYVNFDPMRVAAGIITGIGFLGAGLIVFQEHRLQGLTTAAGLWVVAGLGMAVGSGMYLVAIFATALIVIVFTAVWFLENRIKQWLNYHEQPSLDPRIPGEEI
ncbi:MAG TPA: MgtC/SapB family protein [Candidatus Paceibacterota bacterium]|nr:MgtC/SapB family protein [Candidatus Paceibacterota bacterium]